MGRVHQYMAAISASNGAFMCGAIVGWSAPASQRIVNEEEYGFEVTFEQFAWISSMFPLGALPGCLLIGLLINIIGRKTTLVLLYLPYVIGYLLIIPASNLAMLLAGRFILGFAIGGNSIAIPMYIGEVSEKEIRGTLGTFYQMEVCVGILFTFCVGPYVSLFVLNCVSLLLPIIMGVPFLFMPETPMFLIESNRKENAKKAIIWLRGEDSNPDAVIKELDDLIANRPKTVNPIAPFKQKGSRRSIIITTTIMAFQQLCGSKAVMFYTTEIFKMTASFIKPEFGTMLIGVMQLVAVGIATVTIDKAGRRILLFISAMGMSFCSGIIGLYFYLKIQAPDTVDIFSTIPILALSLFVFFQTIGFSPIAWVLVGEMFSPDVKGIGSSLCAVVHWITGFLVAKVFLNLARSLGMGPTYWLFAMVTVIAGIFTAFCVVETKGLNQSQINDILEGKAV